MVRRIRRVFYLSDKATLRQSTYSMTQEKRLRHTQVNNSAQNVTVISRRKHAEYATTMGKQVGKKVKSRSKLEIGNMLIGLAVLLLASNVSADIRAMSPKEFADFEKDCMQEPECAKAFSALKQKVQEYSSELKVLCETDLDGCVKRQKASYIFTFEKHLRCERGMNYEECVRKLNEDSDRFDHELLYGAWCDSNKEACGVLREESKARKKNDKSWCDVNEKTCQEIITGYKEQNARASESLTKLREEVNKQYESYREIRDEEWYLSRATCPGPADKCLSQINEKMDFFEKRRLDRSCREGKAKTCEELKEQRSNREKQKLSWCDTHKKVCDDAKNRQLAAEIKPASGE